jgi:hypothetical protein
MSLIALIGFLLIFTGAFHLRTYLERKRWPVVEGTLDSVDSQIEARAYTEGVGFSVRPKFIQKIRYSYRDHPYVVEISSDELSLDRFYLRVNPEKPYVAFLDNKKVIFPILAISIGIILILLSINFGAGGLNE